MADLSVLIPSRQEQFLARTVEDVLSNLRGDTEIIVVADGAWPDPPLQDHPRLDLLHYSSSIGQRAACNSAARVSQAKYVMKLDAHCAVAEGFDVRLMDDAKALGRETTQIPRLYNLHAFDWVCPQGHRRYQGPSGKCEECREPTTQDIVWKPRLNRRTDFTYFDRGLHYQYFPGSWRKQYERRPYSTPPIADVMTTLGACWFMERDRYWELGGMEEAHGSWGQMGVEVACKSWLSGGRQVVNKNTWYSHMFRTQGKDFGFPYAISSSEQESARVYSKWLWEGGNWPKAKYPLSWLVEKFAPLPDWHEV